MPQPKIEMTAIILAGGKASRMDGADKAFLKIGQETVIDRQSRLLKKLFEKIIIVTNSPQKYRYIEDIKIISDITPNLGSLGGVYSGLTASSSFYNFVIACDMPFINSRLIKYMCKNTPGYDVVVPKINDRYEPLFCIYSKSCLVYIKQLFDKKVLKISELFSMVKVKEITNNEVLQFASPEKIFTNINTREDLVRFTY